MKKSTEMMENAMLVALAFDALYGETTNEEIEKIEEPSEVEFRTVRARRSLSRKAQRSKRRKVSIRKDREARANEALNASRREYWKYENLGWLDAAPFKERKLAIRAKYLLGETEPVTDVE